MQVAKQKAKRIAIGIVGGVVLIVGIITIPYPGPGWLTVFAGLAILATEFPWAERLLARARGHYDSWQEWLKRQKMWVRAVFFIATSIVVVLTIWLVNGFGIITGVLGLDIPWIHSPLFG